MQREHFLTTMQLGLEGKQGKRGEGGGKKGENMNVGRGKGESSVRIILDRGVLFTARWVKNEAAVQ